MGTRVSTEQVYRASAGQRMWDALPGAIQIPVAFGVGVFRVVRFAVRHPRTTGTVAALGTAGLLGGRWALAGVVLAPVAAAVVWRIAWPASFKARVTPRLVLWQRRWIRYGRRWNGWMARCRLSVHDGHSAMVLPSIQQIEVLPAADRVLVDVPVGMTVEAIQQRTAELANAARVRACRVTEVAGTPGLAWIEFQHTDALASVVLALPIPAAVDGSGWVPIDLDAVPVGRRENGTAWTIPLKGRHVLVAGRSRSGKGSVLWSVLRYLAPAIRAGVVKVSGIDPKGGMELSIGRPLFTRYEADRMEAMADLLEAEADHMDRVATELAGNVRKFSPSMTHPLHLVVIDELATLTAYAPMDVKRRVENALGRLLTKGAAVGWVVLGCVQEPSKDILPMRGLFTYRIALSLDTDTQVDMVLGDGMRERGAAADLIPLSTPGVGYALSELEKEPFRVRAAYVDDEQIRAMAYEYAPITTADNDVEDVPTQDVKPVETVAEATPVEPVECPPREGAPVVPESLLAKLRALPTPPNDGGPDNTGQGDGTATEAA